MSLDAVSDITVEGVIKKKKKHYVFVIQVEWKDGVIIDVYRSYKEIVALQDNLLKKEEFLSYLKNEFAENRTGYLLQGKTLFGKLEIKKRKKVMKKMREVEEFLKSVVHLPSLISTSDEVLELFRPVPDDMCLDSNECESYNMKGSKAKGYALNISEPILLDQYVAVCDYTKTHNNDLNLKAGNIVEVIYRGEHGWWFVDLDGDLGWVPASYLEPRDGDDMNDNVTEIFDDGEEEMYIAMGVFKPDAEDEVPLEVGKIVLVKQKHVDGWWLIRCDGCTGWVPCMYLRELSTTRGSYTRQIERETAMMTVHNIFAITDRRTTWNPVRPIKNMSTVRKATVRRRRHDNKPDDEENPSYVNIEFESTIKEEDVNDYETVPSYINVDFGPNGNRKRSHGNKDQEKGPSYMNMGFHKNTEKSPMRTRRRRDEDGDLLEIDFGKIKMENDTTEIKETETEAKTVKNQNPDEKDSQKTTSDGVSKVHPLGVLKEEELPETLENGTLPNSTQEPSDRDDSRNKENNDTIQEEDGSSGGDNEVFLSIGDYSKDADTEVNLHEGESVEVLEQTDGGWWLVRTQDLSTGWAPSNFLEKITPEELKRRKAMGLEPPERPPVRPPKTSRVYKKAKQITTEKKFWSFVGKNGKNATCAIVDGADVNHNYFSKESPDDVCEVDGSHGDEGLVSCENGVCKLVFKDNTKL